MKLLSFPFFFSYVSRNKESGQEQLLRLNISWIHIKVSPFSFSCILFSHIPFAVFTRAKSSPKLLTSKEDLFAVSFFFFEMKTTTQAECSLDWKIATAPRATVDHSPDWPTDNETQGPQIP